MTSAVLLFAAKDSQFTYQKVKIAPALQSTWKCSMLDKIREPLIESYHAWRPMLYILIRVLQSWIDAVLSWNEPESNSMKLGANNNTPVNRTAGHDDSPIVATGTRFYRWIVSTGEYLTHYSQSIYYSRRDEIFDFALHTTLWRCISLFQPRHFVDYFRLVAMFSSGDSRTEFALVASATVSSDSQHTGNQQL